MKLISRAIVGASSLAASGYSMAQAVAADSLNSTAIVDTIELVGGSVGTVVLALTGFAVTIWGGLRLYSLFSGKAR